ncbi:MAG: HD domain-containing protein [Candidatus Omnitrophota bacterium]
MSLRKKKKKNEVEDLLNFIAEAGLLKRVKRSGWWVLGVPQEESVAEHSFRCAVIGYVLSKMEGVDPYRVLLMTLFNDIQEARINDSHKMAHKYIDVRSAEKEAFKEQVRTLPPGTKNELTAMRKEHDEQETKESLIARDADILECLIQAKEYVDMGVHNAAKFFKEAPKHLKTKSGRKMWKETKTWDSGKWWEEIVKFER